MERFAWKAVVKDGMLSEYKKRHDNIWPELKQVLKDAGISNYTIWNTGNELFGYFECDKGVQVIHNAVTYGLPGEGDTRAVHVVAVVVVGLVLFSRGCLADVIRRIPAAFRVLFP